MIKFIFSFILVIYFHVHLLAGEHNKPVNIKTAVIFNTLCAKCHEGGCSGRLTFHSNKQSANNHIKRYANHQKLTENEIKNFFMLLNNMKKECTLLMPNNNTWKSKNLSYFSLSSSKGYFIPLGNLKVGKYILSFKTKENTSFKVEVISNNLHYYIDKNICSQQEKYIFYFTIDKLSYNFLRVLSNKPLYLMELEVKKKN